MTQLHSLLRYCYAPFYFLGFLWAAHTAVASGGGKIALILLLLLSVAMSFLAERLLPYDQVWNRSNGDVSRDILHAVVNETAIILLILVLPLLTTVLPDLGVWPSAWPLWLQFGAAVLVADFGITMAHYASHRIGPLWRLHAVHHSVKRMYGFNGLMKHPLHQAIELTAGTLPLVLIGLPQEVAMLVAFAVAIQLQLQHSNVDMRIGPLIYIWAVAPGHRHHHIASKTRGDVNFGLFTMIWDHCLGTFVGNRPAPGTDDLGVAGYAAFPTAYWAQLLEPFKKRVY